MSDQPREKKAKTQTDADKQEKDKHLKGADVKEEKKGVDIKLDEKKEKSDEKKEKKVAMSLDGDDGGEQTVILVSQEKKEFKVPKRAAVQSNLVKTALEEDQEAAQIQLVHISAPIVEKVIQYMEYHKDVEPRRIESPLKSTNMKELVDRFDANFVDDMDLDTLMRVLLAANYMDVKSLLGLLCAKVASMMKGKTADQIRKTFNIRGEFTPEEEEEIRKDFKELLVE
jgi:S-phase kinase-associated protein 1